MMVGRTHALFAALLALALCGCSGTVSRSGNLPPVTPIMIPPAMATAASDELAGVVWRWLPAGASEASDRYTLEFMPDGRLQVRADCNRGAGRYTADPDGRLTLAAIALTKTGCGAGSLDAQFARELSEVERYRVEGGTLRLVTRGGGVITLRR
jgi:heat shock protein HslJ